MYRASDGTLIVLDGEKPQRVLASGRTPEDAAAIVAAMNSLPALLECAEAVQKIHDHLSDYIDARKTVDVSVAVAFETSRAALQALAEGGVS